jgi:TRAP-type mannitol/chloroaromatic compound transport system permease small subunit
MQASTAPAPAGSLPLLVRGVGWSNLAVMAAFLVNNFLTFGRGWPGAGAAFAGGGSFAWVQAGLYPAFIILAVLYVARSTTLSLRDDARRTVALNDFIVRAAFWAVVLVGAVDLVLSFMRIEGLLRPVFGEELGRDLARAPFRALYVHLPLMGLGIVIAALTRGLGFIWLALLVVLAELLIVFSRFLFSYEQAFMSDLVRLWYGALFLLASAYTLMEEGHVRVDVFYAAFSSRVKGAINAIGTLFMGFVFCWTILILGMGQRSSIINAPVFGFETSPTASGSNVKNILAGLLGLFAISMMIEFTAYLMQAVADWRDDPGHVEHEPVQT